MIALANPRYAPTGNNVWLVGSQSGHISAVLSIERACGHYIHAHVRLCVRVGVAVPYPCHHCMEIEP